MRTLFVIGLRVKQIGDPVAIWDSFKDAMCDDLARKLDGRDDFPVDLREPDSDVARPPHIDYDLWKIEDDMADQHVTLEELRLPVPLWDWSALDHALTLQAANNSFREKADAKREQLNADQ
ncbi:hypothetical protein E4U19_007804, partial [Claviceps sp. Clav32 group G5]